MTLNSQPSTLNSGFTLIELVISAALAAMILAASYVCLSAGLSTQKLIEPRAEVVQTARVTLALISADLRAACALSKPVQFLGFHRTLGEKNMDADNLDFATHNYMPRRPREADFCQTSYFVEQDKTPGQYSLWRRRNPTIALDPLSGGSRERIAEGLRGLRFEYYDGIDWYDTWGDPDGKQKKKTSALDDPNLSGVPEAVKITLLLDSNPRHQSAGDTDPEPPMAFQTVARLNLATISQPDFGSPAAGNADDSTTTPDNGGDTQ